MAEHDICLVSMPYNLLQYPPIGVAALVAAGRNAGLNVGAFDARFRFAERIGLRSYIAFATFTPFLLGEHTFSGVAFPGFEPDYEGFLKAELPAYPPVERWLTSILGKQDNLWEALRSVRSIAGDFIAETAERILSHDPKIVGCSSSFQQHCASLALLRRIKDLRGDVVTLLGGANCEERMGAAAARLFPWVDFVFSGESDETFPDVCRRLLAQPGRTGRIDVPDGVIVSAATGGECATDGVGLVEELDSLPVPDYDHYFDALGDFEGRWAVYPCLLIEASRGCWWGQKRACTFCGLNGARVRFRRKSAERVMSQLEELSRRYEMTTFIMTDNILDHESFGTFLPRLASEDVPGYRIFCETRPRMNEKQVKLLAAAGMRRIQPGIESLHDAALRTLGKGTSAVRNVALLKFAMENGVVAFWNLLCGIPGDQGPWYDEMAGWLPLVFHLQPPSGVSPIRFDRFSRYHRNPAEFGLRLAPSSVYSRVYPLEPEDAEDLAYFFVDLNRVQSGAVGEPEISRLLDAVTEWQALFKRYPSEEERIRLTVKDDDHRSVVTDTRPCAVERTVELTGLHRLVYRECASPRTPASLRARIQREGGRGGVGGLDEVVGDLAARKLLLPLSGRLLSLALREPVRPLLKNREFLIGCNVEGRLVS